MVVARGPNRLAGRRGLVFWVATTLGFFGLLIGVPSLLVAAHATPPLGEMRYLLVHPGQVGNALARRFSDGATTKLVWSIAWLAWAWFVVCVVVDVVSRVRGRIPGRVPGSRHIQSLVAGLVGASLAFGFPSRQMAPLRIQVSAVSAPGPYERPGSTRLESSSTIYVSNPPAGIDVETVTITSTASEAPGRIYVVKPRDTLWSIAEEELGSPLDWRLIAAANYGRRQPDGEELTDDHWIRPGWLLVIPGVVSGDAEVTQVSPSSLIASETSVPNLHTNGASVWVAPTMGIAGLTTLDKPHFESANDIRTQGDFMTSRAPERDRGSPGRHIPVAPIGYGLLGAGIVALLDRMRRAQQRLRPTGLRIALPEGDLVELERGLRIASDPGSAEWIDLSLRLLSVTVRREHLETPVVSAVLLRPNAVEIVLDPSSPLSSPPPPFEFGSDGTSWILTKSGQRIDALRNDLEVVGIDAPLPSLVTLGRDELGIVLVNMERAGSVAISGPETDPLVQAIAVELATAKWSDQIDLVLVGFGEGSEGLERVSHAGSLKAVGAKMERRARERAALLALGGRATNSETRWQDGGDAWDLCLVVCSPTASVEELGALDDLIEVAGDGSLGVAVVCGCDVLSARWRVRAGGGRVSVDGANLRWPSLSSQPVPSNLAEGVAGLVSVAIQTAGVTPDEGPYESLSLRIPERASTFDERPPQLEAPGEPPATSCLDQPSVLVRVLGPVEITGAARMFTRAWAIELIVYLAVHPGGVSNEQWATALWPDKAMAPASLHSTASAARRSLGTSASGEDHLPRSRGRLALGPGVRTDWDAFVELSQSSRPDDWRQALMQIAGRPFDGLRSPDWVVLEGILATVEAGIVDLACRYARHCLKAFDAPGAEWSARQGLRVSPYDERLYRVLMNAADVAGNPAGVESVMAELVHLVADDVEPFDAVHPETLALYRQLSRRSFAARSH